MTRLRNTVALIALACLAACSSPGMGYRSQSIDPDERLIGVMAAHRGQDVTATCPNGCAETKEARCERCRQLRDERGHIVVDVDRTKIAVERLLLDFPNHAPTLFAAATLAYDDGEPELAASYLDELFARHSAHPEAGVLRSRIAIQEGNLPGARRQIERQIRFTPDHAGLREALSAIHFLEGDLAESLEELEIAERLGAPTWRVAFNRGLIAESAGNPRAAIEQYELALAERPAYRAAISRRDGLIASSGEEAF